MGGSLHPSPRLPAHPRRAAGTGSGVRSHREKLCSLPRRPPRSPPIPGKRRGRSGAAQAAPAGPEAGRRAGGQLRPRRRRGQPGHGAGQRGEPRIPPPNFFSSATSPFSDSPPTPPSPTPPAERPGGRQRAAVREPPRCGQRCRERRGPPGSRGGTAGKGSGVGRGGQHLPGAGAGAGEPRRARCLAAAAHPPPHRRSLWECAAPAPLCTALPPPPPLPAAAGKTRTGPGRAPRAAGHRHTSRHARRDTPRAHPASPAPARPTPSAGGYTHPRGPRRPHGCHPAAPSAECHTG